MIDFDTYFGIVFITFFSLIFLVAILGFIDFGTEITYDTEEVSCIDADGSVFENQTCIRNMTCTKMGWWTEFSCWEVMNER